MMRLVRAQVPAIGLSLLHYLYDTSIYSHHAKSEKKVKLPLLREHTADKSHRMQQYASAVGTEIERPYDR